jgi:hypothetical protein
MLVADNHCQGLQPPAGLGDMTMVRGYDRVMESDARGSLILPDTVFAMVLRVKTTETN